MNTGLDEWATSTKKKKDPRNPARWEFSRDNSLCRHTPALPPLPSPPTTVPLPLPHTCTTNLHRLPMSCNLLARQEKGRGEEIDNSQGSRRVIRRTTSVQMRRAQTNPRNDNGLRQTTAPRAPTELRVLQLQRGNSNYGPPSCPPQDPGSSGLVRGGPDCRQAAADDSADQGPWGAHKCTSGHSAPGGRPWPAVTRTV